MILHVRFNLGGFIISNVRDICPSFRGSIVSSYFCVPVRLPLAFEVRASKRLTLVKRLGFSLRSECLACKGNLECGWGETFRLRVQIHLRDFMAADFYVRADGNKTKIPSDRKR